MSPRASQLIVNIVAMHGRRVRAILKPQKGYRNYSTGVILEDGQMLNVIIYKREPGIVDTIRRADSVSDYLAERGLPTRHTLSERLVRIGKGDRSRYANIYDYLPGETIPWESYSKGHIKALGMMMSDMHYMLHTYDSSHLPMVEDVYIGTLDRMYRYLADPSVINALQTKLGLYFDYSKLRTYAALLQQCKTLGARQALHMDFVRGNILFSGQKVDGIPVISGVLDFEKTASGHQLFDIARTLAFLMVDCKYKSSDKVAKYFLDSGYIKRGRWQIQKVAVNVGGEQHDILALLLDMFLLHDFYKFLKHNPYEDLPHNEHFKRTRDILLRRKLIQKIK